MLAKCVGLDLGKEPDVAEADPVLSISNQAHPLKRRMNGHETLARCRFELLVVNAHGAYDEAPDAVQLLHIGGIKLANLVQPHARKQSDGWNPKARSSRRRLAGDSETVSVILTATI